MILSQNGKITDVLLNGLSISAKEELQSLCCMIGKTMSLRCHFLAVNGFHNSLHPAYQADYKD